MNVYFKKKKRGNIILIFLLHIILKNAIGSERPNIIIVYSDDQGYGDVQSNEHNAPIYTPNIDRIAKEGIICTQGYVCAPTCAPSRAGLMSGIYPQRMGIYTVDNPFQTLPLDRKIAPEFFKEIGYETALIGKWHLGGEFFLKKRPDNRGFDRFYGWLDSTHDYWKANTGRSHKHGAGGYAPIYDQDTPINELPEYLTRTLTDKAIDFIDENKDKPFFLYLAHHCSHVPLHVPKESYDRFSPLELGDNTITTRAMYYELDEGVGRILDFLEKHGIRENTIIVFQSDNGGGEPEAQLNYIYRGGKFTLTEGGIRVPTLISWPAKLPQNVIYGYPIINLDILPTLLSAVELKPETDLEGVNLLPFLTGKVSSPPHQDLFWQISSSDFAIRSGDWKLVYTSNGVGLFNLKSDPQEICDLRSVYPEIVESLLQKHHAWNRNNITIKPSSKVRRYVEREMESASEDLKGWRYSNKFGAE